MRVIRPAGLAASAGGTPARRARCWPPGCRPRAGTGRRRPRRCRDRRPGRRRGARAWHRAGPGSSCRADPTTVGGRASQGAAGPGVRRRLHARPRRAPIRGARELDGLLVGPAGIRVMTVRDWDGPLPRPRAAGGSSMPAGAAWIPCRTNPSFDAVRLAEGVARWAERPWARDLPMRGGGLPAGALADRARGAGRGGRDGRQRPWWANAIGRCRRLDPSAGEAFVTAVLDAADAPPPGAMRQRRRPVSLWVHPESLAARPRVEPDAGGALVQDVGQGELVGRLIVGDQGHVGQLAADGDGVRPLQLGVGAG